VKKRDLRNSKPRFVKRPTVGTSAPLLLLARTPNNPSESLQAGVATTALKVPEKHPVLRPWGGLSRGISRPQRASVAITWAVGPAPVSATGRLDIGQQRSPQKATPAPSVGSHNSLGETGVGRFHRCDGRQLLPAGGRCNRLQKGIALRAGSGRYLRKLRVLSVTRQSVN
jgi:hypothetical protein